MFRYLCERLVYFARVYVGNRHDAEEVVSSAFVKAWNSADRIPSHVPVRNALYEATRNEALDFLKRERRRARLLNSHFVLTPVSQPRGPEEHADDALALRDVWSALQRLPKRFRQPCWLHWYEGWTYEEIGQTLHITPRVAAKYVLQGNATVRQRLRKLIASRKAS